MARYGLAQCLNVALGVFGRRAFEDDSELFAAIAEGLASALHFGNHRGHHFQHLVATFVAVDIIELLKVVNIAHGDGVAAAQLAERPVEGAPAEKAGQLIAGGKVIAVLERRHHKDETSGTGIEEKRVGTGWLVESQKHRGQRPRKSLLNFTWSAKRQRQQNEQRDSEAECLAE